MSNQNHHDGLKEVRLSSQTLHTPHASEIDLSRIDTSQDKLLLTLIFGGRDFVIEARSYQIDRDYLISKMKDFLRKLGHT